METIDESNQGQQESPPPPPPHQHHHATHPYHPRHSHSRQHSLSSTTTANGTGFFQAGLNSSHSPGTTAFSPSVSPSVSSSHHSHSSSRQRAYTSPGPYVDNSTGAPPFQAPQLYDPSIPSSGSNAMHSMMSYGSIPSYPASLAPSVRSGGSGCLYEESVGSMTYASSSSGSGSGSSSLLATPLRRATPPNPQLELGLGKLLKAEQQVLGDTLWDIPYTFVDSPMTYFQGQQSSGYDIPPPQHKHQQPYWSGPMVQDPNGMVWGGASYAE